MSLLLDALRSGRRVTSDAPAVQAAHADSVLATLGYGSTGRDRRPGRRVTIALGVVPLLLATWWVWPRLVPATSPTTGGDVTSERSSRGAAASPLRPTPMREVVPEGVSGVPHAVSSTAPVDPARETPSGPPVTARFARARQLSPDVSREPRRVASSEFQLALYYHRAGDFERALAHYRALLESDELNAEAHNNLGLLFQQKGLLEESAREFQRATFIKSRYARAHNNFGVTLMRQGKLDLATAEFTLASSLDPRDVDARVNLALAQRETRQVEAATATLLNALAIDPSSAIAHYNLALLYDECRETARAVEHYRRFLEHAGVEHAALAPDVRARIEALSVKGQ